MQKGILLVLLTAVVSGFSIFINYYAVKGINPFALTTLKNSIVALALLASVLVLERSQLYKMFEKRVFAKLLAIGFVGGSIPFLLFFYALSLLKSPATAGFIHKTLFLWATIFAIVMLKEKIGSRFILGAMMLLAGNYLFFTPKHVNLFAEALVLIATTCWALENVIAKNVLKELSGTQVAFARMLFGSLFMVAALILFIPQGLQAALPLTMPQLSWVLITSALLFLYVFTYYNGLKHVPVHIATSILLLAQPITATLSFYFLGKALSFEKALGLFLIVCGVVLIVGISYVFSVIKRKVPIWVQIRA